MKSNRMPQTGLNSFNCPHCGAFAQQKWFNLFALGFEPAENIPALGKSIDEFVEELSEYSVAFGGRGPNAYKIMVGECTSEQIVAEIKKLRLSTCFSCKDSTIWFEQKMLHPTGGIMLPLEADMPEEIAADIREALRIIQLSPRSAIVLARLALEKLAISFGGKGDNLKNDIDTLLKLGLSENTAELMRTVKEYGNHAIHVKDLDLTRDQESAIGIIELMNVIVRHLITEPNSYKKLKARLIPAEGQQTSV